MVSDSSPTLVNNIIRENEALNADNGGILIQHDSYVILRENIICNNTAGLSGGGLEIWSEESFAYVENCIIYDNEASVNGSQINCHAGGMEVINSIIGGSTTNGSVNFGTLTPTFIFCNFYNSEGPNFEGEFIPPALGVISGVNYNGDPCDEFMNIFSDPLFVDLANEDFHLTENSLCIDAGHPAYPLDPDGTYIEIGKYYFEPVGIEDDTIVHTKDYLMQNYPNPFNPTTTINYQLPVDSKIELAIYNLQGQRVKQLVSDQLSAGQHSVIWNGKDKNNKQVSSGIYFYKLKTGNFEETKKMILMK